MVESKSRESTFRMILSPKPYRLFSHTADLGIEVRGKDLPDLFSKAAWSFFDLLVASGKIEPNQERLIEVEAPDLETLLIAWLGELLYLFEVRHLVFNRFLVQTLTPSRLQVIAWGDEFNPRKHRLKQTIKAVTYHQVSIVEKKGIWRSRVIFDI